MISFGDDASPGSNSHLNSDKGSMAYDSLQKHANFSYEVEIHQTPAATHPPTFPALSQWLKWNQETLYTVRENYLSSYFPNILWSV